MNEPIMIEGCEFVAITSLPMYLIGKDGRVYSEKSGRMLSASPNRKGYLRVCVRCGGKTKTPSIHRLVLTAFRGERDPEIQSRHMDGDKNNNRLDNLEWGTAKENAADKYRHGTIRTVVSGEMLDRIISMRRSGLGVKNIRKQTGLSLTTIDRHTKGFR